MMWVLHRHTKLSTPNLLCSPGEVIIYYNSLVYRVAIATVKRQTETKCLTGNCLKWTALQILEKAYARQWKNITS